MTKYKIEFVDGILGKENEVERILLLHEFYQKNPKSTCPIIGKVLYGKNEYNILLKDGFDKSPYCDTNHNIVMTNTSLNWSKKVIDFAVMHEVGHIINDHTIYNIFDGIKCYYRNYIYPPHKKEVDADMFAANVLGYSNTMVGVVYDYLAEEFDYSRSIRNGFRRRKRDVLKMV